MEKEANTKEKIILPENTQREMMKFFLKTSIPQIADKKRKMESGESKNPPNPKTEAVKLD